MGETLDKRKLKFSRDSNKRSDHKQGDETRVSSCSCCYLRYRSQQCHRQSVYEPLKVTTFNPRRVSAAMIPHVSVVFPTPDDVPVTMMMDGKQECASDCVFVMVLDLNTLGSFWLVDIVLNLNHSDEVRRRHSESLIGWFAILAWKFVVLFTLWHLFPLSHRI